jgi:hypothetical protein
MSTDFIWVLLRLVVVCLLTWSLFGLDSKSSNIHEWSAALPLGVIPGIAIYIYLSLNRYREGTDFSHTVSLQNPFLPMSRFPLRFWFVTSCSMLIGGATTILADLIQNKGRGPVAAVIFSMGAFIAIALRVWTWRNLRQT